MTGWIKNPNDKHLNRVDANLGNNSGLERNLRKKGLVKHKVDQGTHNNILYPPWTTKPSCFSISALWNVSLELKHQYTYILLKFMGIEGTYQFLWEFEEIYYKICYPNVPFGTVQLKSITFVLKMMGKSDVWLSYKLLH